VFFTENDHVIEQHAAYNAYESFGRAILPRALESRPSGMNAEARDGASHLG